MFNGVGSIFLNFNCMKIIPLSEYALRAKRIFKRLGAPVIPCQFKQPKIKGWQHLTMESCASIKHFKQLRSGRDYSNPLMNEPKSDQLSARKTEMRGHIYISGVFTSVCRADAQKSIQLDNDPHFWDWPPTWGICRPDIREKASVGDYVFFVLPKCANLPQMIYGYMKIAEIITHTAAHFRPELQLKRMGDKNPNGNIIVDSRGLYNWFDRKAHKKNFAKIRRRYAIGSATESEFFTPEKIRRLAPGFIPVMNQIFGTNKTRVIDIIDRWGSVISLRQVEDLLAWLCEASF